MKKYLLTALVLSAAVVSVSAQDRIFNNPDNKAYFGLRVAGEVTCPGNLTYGGIGVDAYKNGGGIEFGAIYNLPVVANFYIEPGLKLYYNAYSANKDLFEDGGIDFDELFDSLSMRKFGMRVPVMAGYHFDFTDDVKVAVFTGPELEVGFSAKEHMKSGSISVSESVYGEDGGLNRVDLSWGFGAGVTYKRLYIGISGTVGMLNMLSDGDGMKFHENRASLTLGYNF
ncbi:MAG: PorT family protein [Muribaculaceae bacterium]|nr:PorT family protein [Muribaculaceae bacterium]